MKPWIALLGLLAAGCISTSNTPPLQYYVLADTGRAPEARRASLDGGVLLVQPTSVSAFYDTQRLVYSRAPGERAYYQFAAWTERPGRAFAELLSRRLGAPLTTSGVRGDLVLHTRLEELYHDASSKPGRVTIEVSAELVDASGRRVGESRRFARSVPTQAENAAAAVEAANRAIAEALDEIAAWTAAAGRERPTASAASSVFRR
ncbi:MAG TPA: LPS assembly lipoprotein LptE [Burkholderiales bacterium]